MQQRILPFCAAVAGAFCAVVLLATPALAEERIERFDAGRARWLRVRYVRGMAKDASPAHGLRLTAGVLLTRLR